MSFGSGDNQPAFRAAVKAAYDAGIPMAVAAGNDNSVTWAVPAVYSESVIAVAAVDRDYKKAWFSNFGGPVKISAPGQDILSCGIEDDYSWVYMNGTSMAAPFVAGTMALFVGNEQLFNDGDAATVCSRLAANQVSGALTGFPANPPTANQLVDIGWNNPKKGRNAPYKDGPPLLEPLMAATTVTGSLASATANSVSNDPNDSDPDVWDIPGIRNTTSTAAPTSTTAAPTSTEAPTSTAALTSTTAPTSATPPISTTTTGPKPQPTACHCNEDGCTADPPDADAGCCDDGTCGPNVPTD